MNGFKLRLSILMMVFGFILGFGLVLALSSFMGHPSIIFSSIIGSLASLQGLFSALFVFTLSDYENYMEKDE